MHYHYLRPTLLSIIYMCTYLPKGYINAPYMHTCTLSKLHNQFLGCMLSQNNYLIKGGGGQGTFYISFTCLHVVSETNRNTYSDHNFQNQ